MKSIQTAYGPQPSLHTDLIILAPHIWVLKPSMWLWDMNNINFIPGYKKYHTWSTTDFYISLAMEWLIDQKTQNSNLKGK